MISCDFTQKSLDAARDQDIQQRFSAEKQLKIPTVSSAEQTRGVVRFVSSTLLETQETAD